MAPPATEIATASPRISPRIVPGVKPSVFSTPTSRTRSRTDMAMVLAETSRIVNITAAEIHTRNMRTLPSNERNPTTNACSDSVLVCPVELRNWASIALAMREECCGSSIRT